MVNENELEGFRRDRYLARAWALLTRDRGWVKPVLVMTVALLVPVVGALGAIGYAVEWARLTAWGVNAAPKQRGVRVGECIRSGWRAFLVMLVWGVCWGVVRAVLARLPLVGDLADLLAALFQVFLSAVVAAAVLRATIYQRAVPGLRVKKVWEMVRHDPGGLARVMGIGLLGAALLAVIAGAIVSSALLSVLPHLVVAADYLRYGTLLSSYAQGRIALQLLLSLVASMGPALLALLLVDGFVGVVFTLLCYTAVGLWMRQFDVPSWGRDEDPLPPFVSDPRDAAPSASAAGSWQAPPQPGAASEGASAQERPSPEPATPAAETSPAPETAQLPEPAPPTRPGDERPAGPADGPR